jgi:hypothetical protein
MEENNEVLIVSGFTSTLEIVTENSDRPRVRLEMCVDKLETANKSRMDLIVMAEELGDMLGRTEKVVYKPTVKELRASIDI